jgi:hypothetical protein
MTGGDMGPAASAAAAEVDLERRVLLRVFVIGAVFLLAVGIINALTLVTEAERSGLTHDWRLPWLLEMTSVVVLVALVPLVTLFGRRVSLLTDRWWYAALLYLAGSILFSALHVVGMGLLRLMALSLIGHPYRLFADLVSDALYEYRKDLLPYALTLFIANLVHNLEEARRDAAAARAEARETGRLTLKTGGRVLFLDATSLDWANAAGNYVEIRAGGRMHLARTSLTALEQQLQDAGVPTARVHRSRLVNRDKVREVVPTRDGDFRIVMTDGSELKGSRRYRQALAG